MAKKKDLKNNYLSKIRLSTEFSVEETMLPINYNMIQEECLAARKNLFWHHKLGYDYKSAGVCGTVSAQEEEQRLLDYTHGQVQFTFVSHRFVYFQIAGSDKQYHITASYKHGNVLTENAKDSVKTNPYLKIADNLCTADRERKVIAKNYLSISARDVFSSIRVSESDFISMEDSDITEMATTLFSEIQMVGLNNLFYTPTRTYINNKLQKCFLTEFLRISIQLNENHLLSAKITTIYDDSRRKRLAKKNKAEKDVADGSSYLTNLQNFVSYVKSAQQHYVKEYKYAHKQSIAANNKISNNKIMNINNSNISTMSENRVNNNSSVNFIVKSIMSLFNKESEVYKYAELGGFNINAIVENSTSSMVSVSVNSDTVIITSKHGYSMTIPVHDFQDEMAYEDIEYGINRILLREERHSYVVNNDSEDVQENTETSSKSDIDKAQKLSEVTVSEAMPDSKQIKKIYNQKVKKALASISSHIEKGKSLQDKRSRRFQQLRGIAEETGIYYLTTNHDFETLCSFLNKKNKSEINNLAA